MTEIVPNWVDCTIVLEFSGSKAPPGPATAKQLYTESARIVISKNLTLKWSRYLGTPLSGQRGSPGRVLF